MIRGVIQDAPKLGLRSTFRRQPAGNGASLDLNFMTGVLPPGVVFTRSNTLGYTDVNGQAKTAGVNQPRLTAQGLMINDAATVGALEIARVNDLAWFNHAAGTFLVEFSVTTLAAGVNTGLSIDDATGNERHVLRVSGGLAGPIVLDGGVSQAQLSIGSVTAGQIVKMAYAYALNDFAASRSGGTVATDSAGTLPTVIRMTIGSRVSSDVLNGYMRRITYWPYRRPNPELQAISL
jgi:hypothetical protein